MKHLEPPTDRHDPSPHFRPSSRLDEHVPFTGSARILTVDTHGPLFFYYAIEAAVLLSRALDAEVSVVFLPARSRSRRSLDLVGGFARRSQIFSGAFGAFQRGELVEITRGGRTISLQKARISAAASLRAWASGASAALKAWSRSFVRGRFSPLSFLHASHRGTRIGDLAAATFFRGHSTAFDLTAHPLLLYWLWRICTLIEMTEIAWSESPRETFSLSPEPGFIHHAPQRHLRAKGAPILDLYQPSSAVCILGPEVELLRAHAQPFPDTVPPRTATPTGDVATYLEARLFDTPRVLSYMTTKNRNDADELLDFDQGPVRLRPDVLYPVLFLHSLSDVQYCFGLDGFTSLAEWTFLTIEMCLANARLPSILIKPHPAGSLDESSIDGRLIAELRRRYANERRVVVLRPDASLVHLARGNRIVGITHHGSVAEELTFLGQPVIASVHAPWGERYRFLRVWSTPYEYAAMLHGLSIENWLPPGDEERAELERFVRDFRLSEMPSECRDPAWLLAKVCSGLEPMSVVPPDLWGLRDAALKSLGNLDQNSAEFDRLMESFELLEITEILGPSRPLPDPR
jgi:hypothetical protein